MLKLTAALVAAAFAVPAVAGAQTPADSAAVRQAVLDYIEGLYEVKPDRVERSVHPTLVKRTVGRFQNSDREFLQPMTTEVLLNVARTFNANGHVAKDAPKDVKILDMLDKTATVKLTAESWVDYMHIAKQNGKWVIVNILWQSTK